MGCGRACAGVMRMNANSGVCVWVAARGADPGQAGCGGSPRSPRLDRDSPGPTNPGPSPRAPRLNRDSPGLYKCGFCWKFGSVVLVYLYASNGSLR